MSDDLLSLIAEERHRVADFLESLTPEQWDTQSCAGEWKIRQVAGHLLGGLLVGNKRGLKYVARARGNIDQANTMIANELAEMGPEAMIAALREHATHPFTPLGVGYEAPLTDVMIHHADMARPLGRSVGAPARRWATPLATATDLLYAIFSARSALKGIAFRATDIDYRHGYGPTVEGPAADLAHAMWGRVAALDALSGEGVETLRSQLNAR